MDSDQAINVHDNDGFGLINRVTQAYFPSYRIAAMTSDKLRRKLATMAILLLVIFAPFVIIGTTLTFLILTGDLVRGEVSPLVFLELYVIELILVAIFTFGLFWLTKYIVREHLH